MIEICGAVVCLFPKGWNGNEGYRSADDGSTTTQVGEGQVRKRATIILFSGDLPPFLISRAFVFGVVMNGDTIHTEDYNDPNPDTNAQYCPVFFLTTISPLATHSRRNDGYACLPAALPCPIDPRGYGRTPLKFEQLAQAVFSVTPGTNT